MQSVDEPGENDRLAAYALHPSVLGVVSWLPVRFPDEARAELNRIEIPKHVGVRCLVADDPMDWLNTPPVVDLFREIAGRGLAWDIVPITEAQIRNVVKLATAVSDLNVVIDHLGRPPIDVGGWQPWAHNMAELAELPNVSMKVSVGINVLTAWDQWDAGAVAPFVTHVVDLFGPERLMLASNWPVVLLRTDHTTAWTELANAALSQIDSEEGRQCLLGKTAERVYGLQP